MNIIKKFILARKNESKIKKLNRTNKIRIAKKDLHRFKLNINGTNNIIEFPENFGGNGKINIQIYGNNNKIIFEEGCSVAICFVITIGQNHFCFGEVNDATLTVGKNTTFEQTVYTTFNSHSFCNIGERCMFSFGINLYNTDAHPIFDKDSGKIINKVNGITIGKHCWIGYGASVMKNSYIPDESILGWNTVYSGTKNTKPNCIYAGNPAKCVKQNVSWDNNGAKAGYIENVLEEVSK